jgi:hypothetical protein
MFMRSRFYLHEPPCAALCFSGPGSAHDEDASMRARFALAATACLVAFTSVPALASDCTRTSTGLIPLTDLGSGSYLGSQGGLYPGGANTRPAGHRAAGLAVAGSVTPLDTLGNPDAAGHVVLISIGMSNCTQEFSTFVPKANADPAKRPRVRLIDCAKGGQATQDIRHPGAAYWDTVATRLRGRGSSPLQAQVVWIKEARRAPTEPFTASAESLLRDLGTIVRIIKQKLPNVRACYVTSRIYAGYASTNLNPEPYAYESGFAVKWLVEAQMNGVDSLNWDPNAGAVEAPWITWGPYLWADGLVPRSDGMTWACDAFQSDGTHPSATGRAIVADSLLAFFKRDETTTPWFVNAAVGVTHPPPTGALMSVAPNPAREAIEVKFAPSAGMRWKITVLDLVGRRLRELARGRSTGEALQVRWDLSDAAGRRVPNGLYWLRVETGGRSSSRRVLVLDPR